MYSAVTLLPELDVGFVILLHSNAGQARTVLEQVLAKHFSAPAEGRTVAYYVDALAREREAALEAGTAGLPPDATAPRAPADAASLEVFLGTWRDPWFGEVTVCPAGGGVRFESTRSPRLAGPVLAAAGRLLVDFDTLGADADAWLDFSPGQDERPARLTMAKVDPEADFSYDYEDLSFIRTGSCGPR